MNPTVTGALIAGGAALVGFAASGWQNSRTIRASNRSAREQRLWDRKAAVYEEIFARIRELEDVESAADLDGVIESLRGLRAGLLLYAPDPVADRVSTGMTHQLFIDPHRKGRPADLARKVAAQILAGPHLSVLTTANEDGSECAFLPIQTAQSPHRQNTAAPAPDSPTGAPCSSSSFEARCSRLAAGRTGRLRPSLRLVCAGSAQGLQELQ